MSKIKVLVVSLDNDGVGYYRLNAPYLSLNDPDIEVKFLSSSDFTFRFTEFTFLCNVFLNLFPKILFGINFNVFKYTVIFLVYMYIVYIYKNVYSIITK